MMIDQGDLLWGMAMLFVQRFMSITTREHHGSGAVIFREGEKNGFFYTLIEGRVRLTVGEGGREVYTVTHAGEGFGWSSLLDRSYYSASAHCVEPTHVHKLHRNDLHRLLEDHPADGMLFYRRFAGMLGNRLVQCYRQL
jgi:CRP-like cAMP-binding protein